MEKKSLIFGIIFILLIIGLIFIFAAPIAPTGVHFSDNTTPTFDKEGSFFVNWTTGGGDEANYTIWISVDGGTAWFTTADNDSATGYVFSNTTNANYTFKIQAINDTFDGANSSIASIVVDDTAPAIAYGTGTTTRGENSSTTTFIFVNVTATDTYNDTLSFTLYNSTGIVNQSNFTDSYATLTINWTGLSEGTYYYNVTANDSATNSNTTTTYKFTYDVTDPVASLACGPSTIYVGDAVTCTCSGTDSGSGINSSATSAATTLIAQQVGTFTVTSCSVTDYAGNSDSASDSYTVSSSGGGTAPTYEWSLQKIHSWSMITPGTAAIMKDFDEEIGLKEIQIQVNTQVQNVKITVMKYNEKPAEVSVEKSGHIYRYLHINAENLEGKLEQAIIRMQIEKSWMTSNGFEVGNMAMFKFNSNTNSWEELVTTYKEADDDYYYYDVEVDSFSYFAISEKAVVGEEGEEEGEISIEKGLKWWKILLIVLAGLIIVYAIYLNRKKIFKFFKKR